MNFYNGMIIATKIASKIEILFNSLCARIYRDIFLPKLYNFFLKIYNI